MCLIFGLGADVSQDSFCCRLVLVRGGYRPYFENYTVDASIFRFASSMIVGFRVGVCRGVGSQF